MAVLLYIPEAAAERTSEKRILVVTTAADTEMMVELRDVLSSHFEDLNVKVELSEPRLPHGDTLEQVFSVRELMQSKHAISAVWVDHPGERVFLMGANTGSRKVIMNFVGSRDSWPVMCDTIAALVSSAVITWLEAPPGEPRQPAPVMLSRTAQTPWYPQTVSTWRRPTQPTWSRPVWTGEAQSSKPSKVALNASDKKEPLELDRGDPKIRMDLFSGYHLGSVDPNESISHGVRVGVGLRIYDYMELSLSTRFISPLDLHNQSSYVVFRHLPIDLGIRWLWSYGRFDWGIQTSVVLDLTALEPKNGPIYSTGSRRFHAGFSPSVVGRVHAHRFLALFVELGADIYFDSDVYKWEDEAVFNYGAVQPYFSLGFAVIMGPG
jgi:hypothetical protein